jgi:hypothetical protein
VGSQQPVAMEHNVFDPGSVLLVRSRDVQCQHDAAHATEHSTQRVQALEGGA